MRLSHGNSQRDEDGFTLVEIMVGLAIGMLLTVVILQVMSTFEAQTRTTTGSADAQTNGGIALHTISSELQSTGFGLLPMANSPQECTTLTIAGVADTTVPNRLTPAAIIHGATASGDRLVIRYASSTSGGVPTPIATVGVPNPTDLVVGTTLGCQVGDDSLIVSGATCAMSKVSAISAVGVSPKIITLADTTAAVTGANLSCLGTWNEVSYRVNNGNLERNGVPSVASIVALEAQYGISATPDSNQVASWVEASAAPWLAPTAAERNRIKAIRVALISRNDKREGADVTAACSSTTSAAPTGLCAWAGSVASPAPAIDLSADADWRKYRYRVFETIIPLRNTVWAKDTL